MKIEPAEGVVLVELVKNKFSIEKDHTTYTSGKILAGDVRHEGQIAHWRGFKDDARVGNNQCLIEIKDILGYENPSNNH